MRIIVKKNQNGLFYGIGTFLIFFYIFTSSNAVDGIMPVSLNSYALYALLAWGIIGIILTGSLTRKISLGEYIPSYFIFLFLSFLTTLYSPSAKLFEGEFYLMLVSMALVIVFTYYVKDVSSFERICWFYAVSSFTLVITLLSTGQLVGNAVDRLGEKLMGNANILATMFMMSVIYEFWMLVYGHTNIWSKILLILMIAGNYYILILSAGKKFFIVPLIFLYLLFLLKTDKNGKKHLLKYTVLAAVTVLLIIYLMRNVQVFYDAIGSRLESFFMGFFGKASYNASDLMRKNMRKYALEQWVNSPVWGYGFDSFKYYASSAIGAHYYSHCNYAELLFSGGIILFVSYYFIYYCLFLKIRNSTEVSLRYKAFSTALMVSFLVLDYTAITYSMAIAQIAIALSHKVITFHSLEESSSTLKQTERQYELIHEKKGFG